MNRSAIFFGILSSLVLIGTATSAQAQLSWEKQERLCGSYRGTSALDACERALVLIPDDYPAVAKAEIYLNLAIAQGEAGRSEEALHNLDHAVELDPDNPKIHYNRGVTLEALDKQTPALHEYRKATELNPQMVDAWGNIGVTAYKTERYEESARAFDTAADLDPSYFDSRPDQRALYEKSKNKKPLTFAMRREVSVRFSPNLGYFLDAGSSLNVNKFLYLLFDTGVDVQIYKKWYGTASFLYGHTKWKSFASGSGMDVYAPTFGVKFMSREPDYTYPGETGLDHARFWFSLAVGPYITDLSAAATNPGGTFSQARTKVDIGFNTGAGIDYYFHPNVGVGVNVKLDFINFDENYFIVRGGPHIIARF